MIDWYAFLYTFLIPFVLGAIFVGASTERTIMVYEGKVVATGFLAVIVSGSVFFNIKYVVDGKLIEFAAFSCGTWVITCVLAYRRKRLRAKSLAINDNIRNDIGV